MYVPFASRGGVGLSARTGVLLSRTPHLTARARVSSAHRASGSNGAADTAGGSSDQSPGRSITADSLSGAGDRAAIPPPSSIS